VYGVNLKSEGILLVPPPRIAFLSCASTSKEVGLGVKRPSDFDHTLKIAFSLLAFGLVLLFSPLTFGLVLFSALLSSKAI
jgi:hypothetical protein